MRKFYVVPVMFIVLAGLAGAQETKRFDLGFGIEGNMNTYRGAALNGNINFDYEITNTLAAGIKFGFNHNFRSTMVLEPGAHFRWYFFNLKGNPLFVQGDLGASLIFEDATLYPAFMGGITAGVRFPLKNWYLEPYIRGGYPFLWGIGVIGGFKL
jgi:hypothetical protein